MRSIRLSLIVYFLLLLVAGLGTVCVLFYLQAERTLAQKEESTRQLYEKEFQTRRDAAHAQLDKQLLEQMRSLASRTRGSNAYVENMVCAASASLLAPPQGELHIGLMGLHPQLVQKRFRARPLDLFFTERPEMREETYDTDPPDPVHFHLFNDIGLVMQEAPSALEGIFTLDDDIRKSELYTQRLDTVTIEDRQYRRVTFKGSVPRSRLTTMNFGFRWPFMGPPPGFKGSFKSPPRPRIIEAPAPTFYLMCEADLAPVKAQVAQFQKELDDNVANLGTATQNDLKQLRSRLTWISVVILAGLALGGIGLLRLGLRPLNRLSDAVSKVNEKDFHLKIDAARLPIELQPIADRMKHALEQLEKAFDREKQASADISHELRTPLAALLTNVDVALRKNRSAQEYREVLEECRSSGHQMYHLVERLLALARLDAGAVHLKAQHVDLGTLARQCANLVQPLAEERGLSLRVQTGDSVLLKGDPDKLREVVTNLLHNAIEYNKPAGSINLSVQRENGHVQLAVKDTGIGIPVQARGRIFERFFRADPSRHADSPHAGLGLSIVKSYVDLMGGQISVDSSDAGTTFTIALPAIESMGGEHKNAMLLAR